ncbi:MAG: di-trans,poly-cis-decaprenylcistransferase [Gammaproteobacteria bacterium RIFCSPHIGHO2_12_FULL_41_20]|nr:MAG: di-trans,poly-cis-decaprenylcistransferase [Gammaproteobacteria bacterium RIFCSPHIGHO2_12_FULL_41_20]
MTNYSLPRHIAIIMDGNGRWAKKRFLPRTLGHQAGVEAVRRVIRRSVERKIEVLSLFAFSSENWRRPPTEVNFLFELFLSALKRETVKLHEQNVRLRVIGEVSRFDDKLRQHILDAQAMTAKNTGMTLVIAANYGGQWDICEAIKKLAVDIEQQRLASHDITPERIAAHLAFADLPNPDLFIRTSGEQRISNFMLWQMAYTELYFTDVLWPDFNAEELDKAIDFFVGRERRFGYISEQLQVSHA